ncbi:MAG TPA: hypothetical protein VLG40_01380, partial [Candidatus Saccharimonas sp.]|nr:hypothetical protein [Candidatus Saccharimonas sp.]
MTIELIILGAVVLALVAIIFVLSQRLRENKNDSATMLLKQDLLALNQGIGALKEGLQTHLTDRLDKNQELMRDSLTRQFSASAKLITDVTERLTKLDE